MAGKRDMTEEQVAKWPNAIKLEMEKDRGLHGGILFEAWVVMARK
jgi:hypothetical protein